MVLEAGLCLVFVRASYLLLHLDPTGQGVAEAVPMWGLAAPHP